MRVKWWLFLICIFLIFTNLSCGKNYSGKKQPKVVKGVLDLRGWDFEKDGPIEIKGQWAFYWKEFIDPDQFLSDDNIRYKKSYMDVPGVWNSGKDPNDPMGKIIGGEGFATYALKITGLSRKKQIDLALRLEDANTAYSLYFCDALPHFEEKAVQNNDFQPMMTGGIVSSDSKTGIPQFLPVLERIKNYASTNYIIIHVSNYHHKYGGFRSALQFGTEKSLRQKRDKKLAVSYVILGILVIMAIYHLGLFIQRREDKSSLLFSLFSFNITLYSLFGSSGFLYELFPNPSVMAYEILHKINIFTVYAALPLFYSFIGTVFKDEFPLVIRRYVWIVSILFILTLGFPARIFTQFISYYEIMILIICMYIVFCILKAVMHKRIGALISLVGFIVLFLTIINDILYDQDILHSTWLLSYGLVVFIFAQSFILSVKFSHAHRGVEKLNIELQRLRNLLSNIIDSMPSVLVGVDASGRVIQWNHEAEVKTGVSAKKALGQMLEDVFPQIEDEIANIDEAIINRAILKNEKILHENTGDTRYSDVTVYPLVENGVEGAVIRIDDVTERKQAEEALYESEEKYRDILENIEEGYFELDLSGKLQFYNRAVSKAYGYSQNEIMNMDYREYTTPETSKRMYHVFNQVYESGQPAVLVNCEIINKDGTLRNLELSVSLMYDNTETPIGFRGMVRDTTDRIKEKKEKDDLMKQFHQAQKMEAIGTLAGGIAHDFNNILSAIFGYTELSMGYLDKESQIYNNLSKVIKASSRARDLIRQILTFSRQSKLEQKPVHVTFIANETLNLLRASLPTTIEIKKNFQTKSTVMADPTQIHQILMNLCTNAAHAMRENGGILELNINDIKLDTYFTDKHPNMTPGTFLQVTVKDTGHGISPELKNRIFDPFFTTKEKGEGTGMGLSVVHGIIRNYGGTITVESEINKGAAFHVFIPAIEDEVTKDKETSKLLHGGDEKILFVDDEEFQVDICKQSLTNLGYSVMTRTSSIDALEVFQSAPHNFDLVITDMTMPKMTGVELAKKLLDIRSDIPIILCTGYHDQISEKNYKALGIKGFVMKPIILKELSNMIRMVLENNDT